MTNNSRNGAQRNLSKRNLVLRIKSRHDMEQTLTFDIVTSARGFAINGNVFCGADFQTFHEEAIRFFKGFWLKQIEDATEGIVRGNAMFEGKIILEPFELCIAEGLEVGIRFGTADDGGEGNKKDFFEGIFDSTGPSSGIVNFFDDG